MPGIYETISFEYQTVNTVNMYSRRVSHISNRSCLMYVLNASREDQHLEFLNEEGLEYLSELYKDGDAPFKEDAIELQQSLSSCHSLLLFQLCSLLSAYLLTRHVQKVHMNVNDRDEQSELIQRDCIQYYEISYTHLLTADDGEEAPPVDKQLKTPSSPVRQVISKTENVNQLPQVEQSEGSPDNSSDDFNGSGKYRTGN